ncbi:phosphoadenosine phosphosulfate reductase family protein, partial [Rhizobium ruizarguesonis]
AAFGGARRDEEASRANERIYSFRTPDHRWDPRNQRPELCNIYNGMIRKGESVRAFPLSNWTEVDIWRSGLVSSWALSGSAAGRLTTVAAETAVWAA